MFLKEMIKVNLELKKIKKWILDNSFERKYWMQPAPKSEGFLFAVIKNEEDVLYLEPLSAVNGITKNLFSPVIVLELKEGSILAGMRLSVFSIIVLIVSVLLFVYGLSNLETHAGLTIAGAVLLCFDVALNYVFGRNAIDYIKRHISKIGDKMPESES